MTEQSEHVTAEELRILRVLVQKFGRESRCLGEVSTQSNRRLIEHHGARVNEAESELEQSIDALIAERDQLRAEVERMRPAIKRFAVTIRCYRQTVEDLTGDVDAEAASEVISDDEQYLTPAEKEWIDDIPDSGWQAVLDWIATAAPSPSPEESE